EQYEMFGMFFLLYCGIGLTALLAGGVLYWNAESIFDASMTANELSRTKIILALMVFNLAITFPFSLFGSIITAYEQFVFQKVIAIARIILNTVTMIVLLNFGYKAIAMVVVTTIFNVLTLGLNFWYCKHYLKIKLKFAKFKWGFLKEVSIYSFWIFLNAIMDRIYWSTGQFVLGAYAGTAMVAVFAVAIQLEHMYMSFSTAISGVFLPKVTAMAVRESDGKAISDLFIKTGRIQYCVMILVLTGFFLFGRPFIRLWAGAGYDDAYVISMLFFVPLTVPLIQNLGITILQARNQMKFRSLLYLAISLISLGAQIPLSKYYGGIGCACAIAGALVLGQILVMNVYYQVKQKIDIVGFWKEIIKMSIVPGVLTALTYYVLQQFALDSVVKLVGGIVLYLVVYLPLFFMLSMNAYERNLILKPIKKILKRA
ncbi:MAG: oligosaccharide flippase family protein, partial [Fibrobacter sp.]|nr:oligosaccharide flippase family protein [Fibrobacter sp.]